MAPRAARETAPRTRKRKQAAEDAVRYRFVTKLFNGKWVVSRRGGFGRVPGTHCDAKSAAEAAAAAWNLPLSSFVKTSFGVASREWTPTDYRWIWRRGAQHYVLKRRVGDEQFGWCARDVEELVTKAMLEWGLTRAEMTRAEVTKAEVTRAVIPGGAEEEEVPASPEAEQEGDGTKDQEDSDSNPPADANWGAVKFVAAAIAADPRLLPCDVADLEGRTAGHTLPNFAAFCSVVTGRCLE